MPVLVVVWGEEEEHKLQNRSNQGWEQYNMKVGSYQLQTTKKQKKFES